MKTFLLSCLLALVAGVAGMTFVPLPALASLQAPMPAPVLPKTPRPAVADFSDADFAAADQPELGNRAAGDAGLGLLIFLLLLVLVILFIYWLIDTGRLRL